MARMNGLDGEEQENSLEEEENIRMRRE